MPVWHLTVNLKALWHNTDITFPSKRDAIVEVIKASGWRDMTSDQEEFDLAIEELSEVLNNAEFDSVFHDLYNLADDDRVWIETR